MSTAMTGFPPGTVRAPQAVRARIAPAVAPTVGQTARGQHDPNNVLAAIAVLLTQPPTVDSMATLADLTSLLSVGHARGNVPDLAALARVLTAQSATAASPVVAPARTGVVNVNVSPHVVASNPQDSAATFTVPGILVNPTTGAVSFTPGEDPAAVPLTATVVDGTERADEDDDIIDFGEDPEGYDPDADDIISFGDDDDADIDTNGDDL